MLPAAVTNGGDPAAGTFHPGEGVRADVDELVHSGRGAKIAQSPTVHGPPSWQALAKMVWLPIWQSCAKCTYAMIQLSLPTRVHARVGARVPG